MGYKNLKFKENSVFLVTGGAGFIGSNLCEARIGRADIEESKSCVNLISQQPQASCPGGNLSVTPVMTTSCFLGIVRPSFPNWS